MGICGCFPSGDQICFLLFYSFLPFCWMTLLYISNCLMWVPILFLWCFLNPRPISSLLSFWGRLACKQLRGVIVSTPLFVYTDFPRDVAPHHRLTVSFAHVLTAALWKRSRCQLACARSSMYVKPSRLEKQTYWESKLSRPIRPDCFSVCLLLSDLI